MHRRPPHRLHACTRGQTLEKQRRGHHALHAPLDEDACTASMLCSRAVQFSGGLAIDTAKSALRRSRAHEPASTRRLRVTATSTLPIAAMITCWPPQRCRASHGTRRSHRSASCIGSRTFDCTVSRDTAATARQSVAPHTSRHAECQGKAMHTLHAPGSVLGRVRSAPGSTSPWLAQRPCTEASHAPYL